MWVRRSRRSKPRNCARRARGAKTGSRKRYGFETIGLHKIVVTCIAENVASRRVIEKAAFRWVGRAEDDVWRDGKWHAHLLYELTAPEWPDVHTTLRVPRPKTLS